MIDAHPGTLYDVYAHAAASSQQCASVLQPSTKSGLGVGSFVSTASVARDMLEIMTKSGQEKLQYWGFSYGTFLGATFAALYPDKVGRMVNDGNVDAVEYSSGRGIHFLQDTDTIMEAFYHFCRLAGPELCAFHEDSEKSIETRLQKLLENIKKNPVIVPGSLSSSKRPQIISYSSVRKIISSTLYRPLVMFPALADSLAALEVGDGSVFLDFAAQGSDDPFLCDANYGIREGDDSPDTTPEVPEAEGSKDGGTATLCSDGGIINDTVDEFGVYVDKLVSLSKSVGASMASMRLACVGWSIQAKWRFDGMPLDSESSRNPALTKVGPFEGNTSHPILFIANKADNVTPLRSAKANAKGYPNSVILVQNGYGVRENPSHENTAADFKSSTLPCRHLRNAQRRPFEPIFRMERSLPQAQSASQTWSRSSRTTSRTPSLKVVMMTN